MELHETFDILMFAAACGFLMMGFPVAFTLSGVALIFGFLGYAVGIFDLSYISALPNRIFGNAMTNEVLLAVPLFVFMGVMLERSKVAEELLETMGKLFGNLRGGLGISVSIVGALLAASTGIVGATVVTMGLLSLPTMMRRGYDPSLACGSICAAGTLGQIIPPSIVLVILGDQISNAYVDAQREIGNWSPEPVSVGDLFAGALLPGLMLVGMYICYQIMTAYLKPESSPHVPQDDDDDRSLGSQILHALLPPVILIVSVLGSILAGIATPTEAAAVGAIGATFLAGIRVNELDLELKNLTETAENSIKMSRVAGGAFAGLIVGALVGAVVFDAAFVGLILGTLAGLALVLTGSARTILSKLDTGTNAPIYAAAAAILFMLVLINFVDLRIQRDTIQGSDLAGVIAAGVACVIVLRGLLIAVWRVWAAKILGVVNRSTMEISSMVFVILIGASLFSLVFRGFGGEETVHGFLTSLPGGEFGAILVVMIVMFILGFFLDFIEITFVVVPIVAPVLLQSDTISPVWLGILMAMNLQTSFLTPPFGFALFYLRGVAPRAITTMQIYKGVLPFIVIQVIAIAILWSFPDIANWLPKVIFGTDFGV